MARDHEVTSARISDGGMCHCIPTAVWPPASEFLVKALKMFDVWGQIARNGRGFVEKCASRLTPLEWVEVGEMFPDLLPESLRDYDWGQDSAVIRESPFRRLRRCGNHRWKEDNYSFRAINPRSGREVRSVVCTDAIIATLTQTDICYDSSAPVDRPLGSWANAAFVCSCGDPMCDGWRYERCHVSKHLVHWSLVKDGEEIELYYDRKSYDAGIVRMVRGLVALAHSKNRRRRRSCGVYDVIALERTLAGLVLDGTEFPRRDSFAEFAC